MYKIIYNTQYILAYTGAQRRAAIGAMSGQSIKIFNFTKYGLQVWHSEELIDYIPPYQFLVTDNDSSLSVQLDPDAGSSYTYPMSMVAAKTISQRMPYYMGRLIDAQNIGEAINVAGDMNISGPVDVNMINTPNVNIAGTPSVAISGNPTVNLAGTPSVAIAGSVNANIVSGSVNANIQNAQISTQVVNANTSPVPVASIAYYGDGSNGAFNPTGSSYVLNNPFGQGAAYHFTSINIPSGTTVTFQNQAKFIILYCQGDCVINGTLAGATALQNTSGGPTISINGKTLPTAGSGGAGGEGGKVGNNGGVGGAGGIGNQYAPGNGGGGGGGGTDNSVSAATNGSGGGTGYGNVAGGAAGSPYGGNLAGSAETFGAATLAIVVGGTLTINGTLANPGTQGGAGGSGLDNTGGGGGSCGNNRGGNGANKGSGSSIGKGGGGAGGSGGGVVFLFAGGFVSIPGTINVNGGLGGAGGIGTDSSVANAGSPGQAGTIVVWQNGGNLSA